MENFGNKEKFLIFIPAFNVETKIIGVIKKIPQSIMRNYYVRILIIEDFSKDNTRKIIEEYLKNENKDNIISCIKNDKNHGYGGVQKIAFDYAVKNNFNFIIMLHGDGQYSPEKIPEFFTNLEKNKFDAVFGSRFIFPKDALKGGMPLYKFIGNRVLTFIQNLIIGSKMSEFHSGYRSYRVSMLKKINYQKNTNNFHFDTEIIYQMLKLNYVIKEIAMPTHYGDEVSHLKSIPYGLNIILSTIKYKFFNRD